MITGKRVGMEADLKRLPTTLRTLNLAAKHYKYTDHHLGGDNYHLTPPMRHSLTQTQHPIANVEARFGRDNGLGSQRNPLGVTLHEDL